jgi:hypothetical protein
MGKKRMKGLLNRVSNQSHDDDDIIAVISHPPIIPAKESYRRVEQVCSNFFVSTTPFPELTLPIESTIPSSQYSDLVGLIGVVVATQVGPASGFVIGLNRVVNSSIYRVPAAQIMPGTLFELDSSHSQFTPYLHFVGDVNSIVTPQKKTVYLDLDEYQ